jgi:hypothetical protein
MNYPERHHPVFMLMDALQASGVTVEFAKDERTRGCWGMIFPDLNNRVAVWLIDNRWSHEAEKEDPAALELLASGALVMHAQRRDMERIGGVYLPLAASPGYRNLDGFKTHDAAFVGYVRDINRVNLLADVGAKFRLNFKQGIFGYDAIETYCVSKCGINVPTRYGHPQAYDIPMRVFEIAATGSPLVTNDLPELPELGFLDGVTCVTYGKTRSITDAVKIALDAPKIGMAALALVNERHTYLHRAKQVMQWLSA